MVDDSELPIPEDAVTLNKAAQEVDLHWETVKRWADNGDLHSWARPRGRIIMVSLAEVKDLAQWKLRQVPIEPAEKAS